MMIQKYIKTYILSIAFLVMAVVTLQGSHTSVAQTSGTVELLDHFNGHITTTFAEGNTLYIGGGRTVTTLDISDPENPTVLGHTPLLQGNPIDIEVVGSLAYVALGVDGMSIIDVTDTSNPTPLSSFKSTSVTEVKLSDSIVYAIGGEHFITIDVSDPTNLTLLAFFNTGNTNHDIQLVGNIAYVGTNGGLMSIDVSDPNTPIIRSTLTEVNAVYDVEVFNTIAYVLSSSPTTNDRDIWIVNVSDLDNPTVISSAPVDYIEGNQMEVVGSIARITGSYYYNGCCDDGTVYVSRASVDVSDLNAPVQTNYRSGDQIIDMQIVGNRMFEVISNDHTNYVRIAQLDVDGLSTTLSIFSMGGGDLNSIQVEDNIAYLAGRGLLTLNVNDPSNIKYHAYLEVEGVSSEVQVVEDIAYLAVSTTLENGFNGLKIVDVSDPTQLTKLSEYSNGYSYSDYVNSLQILGNVVYLDAPNYYSGIPAIDVTDPSNPTTSDSDINSSHIRFGQIVENIQYIPDGNNGLLIRDVTDPQNPFVLTTFDAGTSVRSVHVVDGLIYLLSLDRPDDESPYENILYVLEYAQPAIEPTVIDTFTNFLDGVGVATDVYVVDNHIYMATGGLSILEYTRPVSSSPLKVTLNDSKIEQPLNIVFVLLSIMGVSTATTLHTRP